MAEKTADASKIKEDEGKKSKGAGGCLVVLLILVLTPLLAAGALYFFNSDFNMSVNSIMSNVPGPVGSFFEKFPTREEEQAQVRTVANYMLDLTTDRAVDKMLVLQGDDAGAYDAVVQDMLRINPNKTQKILQGIRDATVSPDALLNTVQNIEAENTQNLESEAAYLESLPINDAVDEVNQMISDSLNGHSDVAAVFEYLSDSSAMQILYQLDQADRNKIFSYLSDDKAASIKTAYSDRQRRESELEQIAGVYASEDASTLIDTIGNTNTYTLDELAVIYENLGPKKAGEVLAKSTDDSFVFSLVSAIKADMLLKEGEDLLTPDILKSLKVYKEFDDNVTELVSVYSQMDTTRMVENIQNMMLNASPSTVYELDNGDLISFSDEDIVLALLKNFSQKTRASILSSLDQTLSSELTRKLALPGN
ncbi:MAG: hypothetical protein PWQ12_365 [Clostridiales bacterium]|nr:hypothetical protein [Clostridiales bacterium]